MKTSVLFLLCVLSVGCANDPPKRVPDIAGHVIGVVTSTNWNDRTFMIEEDKTQIAFELKGCGDTFSDAYGPVPVWQKEHVEIWYRRGASSWGGDNGQHYRGCQYLDKVVHLGDVK